MAIKHTHLPPKLPDIARGILKAVIVSSATTGLISSVDACVFRRNVNSDFGGR